MRRVNKIFVRVIAIISIVR